MGFVVRILLAASGAIAAIFVSRDAENFGVISAMIGVALFAAIVVIAAVSSRK